MENDLKTSSRVYASRQLHLFWVVDCSSSMRGEKTGVVNNTIQSLLPEIIDEAAENSNVQILIRTLKFSTGASWTTKKPVKIEEYVWQDLEAGGERDLGKAFDLLAKQLDMKKIGEHTCPHIIVLITNGPPTDDYKNGLKRLLITPWGKTAVRIAIPIGQEIDENVLLEFTGSREYILQVNEANRLRKLIRRAFTNISGDIIEHSQDHTDLGKSSVSALLDSNIINEILKICPDVWRESKKFKALLMDYLPNNKRLRNLILISAEEKIPDEIANLKCLNSMNRHYYLKRLIDATGCMEEYAEIIINMWEEALIVKP